MRTPSVNTEPDAPALLPLASLGAGLSAPARAYAPRAASPGRFPIPIPAPRVPAGAPINARRVLSVRTLEVGLSEMVDADVDRVSDEDDARRSSGERNGSSLASMFSASGGKTRRGTGAYVGVGVTADPVPVPARPLAPEADVESERRSETSVTASDTDVSAEGDTERSDTARP